MKTENLIRRINVKLARKGLTKPGDRGRLADALGVSQSALSMALNGYRETKRSVEILSRLNKMLDSNA